MGIELGRNLPFLDNWPIYRQLWQFADSRLPGEELDLSVALNRNLTFQFRNLSTGLVDLITTETDSDFSGAIAHPTRGVVYVKVIDQQWEALQNGASYVIETIAYGILYDSHQFTVDRPEAGYELLNGVEVLAAPREVLELIGNIPGANVQISVPLVNASWSRDQRGYWTTTIPAAQQLYGLWFNDCHCRQVDYEDLALSGRAFARVATSSETHTLYYLSDKEKLNDPTKPVFVETAFNRYVLRCLEEASAEFERRTGRFFSKRRVLREVHRGLARQSQIALRQSPVEIDQYFRLDALSYAREVYRRYTEKDFSPDGSLGDRQTLFVNRETGVLTLNQSVYDWWEWGNDASADYGIGAFAFLPRGEDNIEISYTAGPDKPPTDVSEAVGNMAAVRQAIFWQMSLSQGLSGISIGCVNFNFGQFLTQFNQAWQSGADRIIEQYTNIEIEAL